MEQILKYCRTAHAYANQGDYNDAIEYLKHATTTLTRFNLRDKKVDPYQQGQLRLLHETFVSEIKQLEQYREALSILNDVPFGARRDNIHPAEQQWSSRQHMPKAVVHARESPLNTPAAPVCGDSRSPAPGKPQRTSKPPNLVKGGSKRSIGNSVPAKVNSNRVSPKVKTKQPHAEPWDSWEGQDKELASNLSNDIMDASPGVRWDDIAGLQDAKRILQEAMVLPLLRPELFVGIRKPVKGVLLFGPPGTGKTLLARALATECDTTFFTVSSSTLASKWRGESERMVRVMFAMAYSKSPATIFIDEVDALCSSRGGGDNEASRRVKTEMLVQINGIQSGAADGGRVMVMGATNFPWDLDEALRRRLEKRIYIPLPAATERKVLLHINLKGVEIADDCDFDRLADMGEGYSGDDITNVCREAAMNGLRRIIDGKDMLQIKAMDQGSIQEPVRMEDFLQAFDKVRPSVGKEEIIKHERWRDEYGST